MGKEPGADKKKIVLPSSGLAEDILAGIKTGIAAGQGRPEEKQEPVFEDKWDEEKKEEDSLHLVGFFLNSEEYALDISQVQEIIRVGGWTRVPNSPRHIKGVINLRGRIIPVIDPKVRMELMESEPTKDARIMVVEAGDGRVLGILVDGVSQVLRLPTRVVEAAPEEVSDSDKGFIKGVGKPEGRLIILLDLSRVVGREVKASLTEHL
jgi:purine-binding chemotaxis protein CheW